MRLSREQKEAKIIELYKDGWSYRQLQKRYYVSPRDIAKLVEGIEVKCAICGKLKGKIRFASHHPDRVNYPHDTIPLCPSCHAKEEAKIRKEKETEPRVLAPSLPTILKKESFTQTTSTILPRLPLQLLSKTGKVVIGSLIIPALFPNLWNDIQRHWQEPENQGRRPIMGLRKPPT